MGPIMLQLMNRHVSVTENIQVTGSRAHGAARLGGLDQCLWCTYCQLSPEWRDLEKLLGQERVSKRLY